MKPVSLDSRLKDFDRAGPSATADRFPLMRQSFYDIFRAIDTFEMDGIGLYEARRFPFGMLPLQLLDKLQEPARSDAPVLSFDGAVANVWQLLWHEYHIGESDRALPRPHSALRAELLYQLLRELLITPFLRIDALRRLPRFESAPCTRTLTVYALDEG